MSDPSPSLDIDLFSDEAIADPYPLYKQIRNAGPAVWLENYDMWAISRFEDVRAALRADSTLLSGEGVAVNPALNNTGRNNSLVSDGDEHRRLRAAVMKPMMPSALRDVRGRIEKLCKEGNVEHDRLGVQHADQEARSGTGERVAALRIRQARQAGSACLPYPDPAQPRHVENARPLHDLEERGGCCEDRPDAEQRQGDQYEPADHVPQDAPERSAATAPERLPHDHQNTRPGDQ